MSRRCEICGKGTVTGFNVSHSKRHTKRTWAPNLQKHVLTVDGFTLRVLLCTRCLRTIRKPAA